MTITRRPLGWTLAALLLASTAACKVEKAAPQPPTVPASQPTAAAEPSSAPAEKKDVFGTLSLEEMEARIKDAKDGKLKLAIYDNNGEDRFKKSRLPGARWVKFDAVTAADLPADKDTTLVFYCANEH